MKYYYLLLLIISLSFVACQQSEEIQVSIIPNQPFFQSVSLAEMDTTGIIKKQVVVDNVIDTINYIDSVIVKDRSIDLTNIWASATLAEGCKVEPLDGAPKFGQYADFSKVSKYRVTAPTGKSADWNLVVGYYVPTIGCIADRWDGDLKILDGIWSGWSPAYCTGVKVNSSCNKVKVTFPFWQDQNLLTTLELDLGDYDKTTFQGPVTMANDVHVVGSGYDLTFHKGVVGTYNLLSSELNLAIVFDGYPIPPADSKYTFTIWK
ncbi:MAG: hypothetical protein Q8862_02690 [Bacteroidota bacterium]|nr:hypothetical protein [Bacteroidota bacterium]